ncbi:hypothetical protein GN316_18820 [Xylophilus sp. Kf1]|nr:hypothetical protein [Xylophilus sp. Kf1]
MRRMFPRRPATRLAWVAMAAAGVARATFAAGLPTPVPTASTAAPVRAAAPSPTSGRVAVAPRDVSAARATGTPVAARAPSAATPVFDSLSAVPMENSDALLTPRRYLQLVVARNAEVAYARLQSQISERGLTAESTLYQPVLFSSLRHENRLRQRTAEEQLASLVSRVGLLDENVDTIESGLRMRAVTGAEVTVSVRQSNRRNNLIATNYGYYKESTAQLVVNMRQPLLKGYGRDVVEADLKVAEAERDVGYWTYRQQLLKMGNEALSAYWQLQRAYRIHPLREKLLANARDAVVDAEERSAAGRVPVTTIDETRAFASIRESDVLRSAQSVSEAEARIRTVLDLPPDDNSWRLGPQDALAAPVPDAAAPSGTRWEQVVDVWPPYKIATLRVRQNEYRLRFAENQTLPQLDLQANWGTYGLGRNQAGAVDPTKHNRYPDWYVGLYFEAPIGRVTRAEAQFQGQALKLSQAELEARNARTTFANDWQTRSESAQLARRDVVQLRADLASRVELLRVDQEALRSNLAPRARVLRRESERLESEVRLVEGEARLLAILTLLAQSDGTLLSDYGVDINSQ